MVPVSWLFSSDSVVSPAAFASVAGMDPACMPGVTRDTLEPAISLLIDAAKVGEYRPGEHLSGRYRPEQGLPAAMMPVLLTELSL